MDASDKRRYKCDICNKSFIAPSHLLIHQNLMNVTFAKGAFINRVTLRIIKEYTVEINLLSVTLAT